MELHYRGNTYLFVLEVVPLLFGLAFLAPNILVLSASASLIGHRIRRRAPAGRCMKLAFNVASVGIAAAAIAAIVFREILGSHSPVSLLGWAAAAQPR